jgi:hypothetical protein
VFQANVPSNWQALSSQNSIKFVPQNGYGQLNGQAVFTHGAEVGVMRAQSRDLADATDAVLDSLASAIPNCATSSRRVKSACRSAPRSTTGSRTVQPPATGSRWESSPRSWPMATCFTT